MIEKFEKQILRGGRYRLEPHVPDRTHLCALEQEDLIRALFRVLLIVKVIFTSDPKDLSSRLPELFKKCRELELLQCFVMLYWFGELESHPAIWIEVFHAMGFEDDDADRDLPCDLTGFKRAHAESFREVISSRYFEDPDDFFRVYGEFERAKLGRERLVGEIFHEKVVEEKHDPQWWEIPGVWDV